MIELIKQASLKTLPELPEPLPVFYGGEINAEQLKELFDKQVIDGVYVDGDRMTADDFVKLIDTIGA
jgi:triosephosphate isomerase